MRRRRDRVKIISDKYAGHFGSVESNVHQRTVDYTDKVARAATTSRWTLRNW